VSNPPDSSLTFVLTQAATNVQSVTNLSGSTNVVNLQLNFRMPAYAGVGAHTEDVAVRACYDSSCVREVPGSPLMIHTTYTVSSSVPPESGLTPLPYDSRTPLSHDVIDAEYDRALEAIVMVSSSPTNALYLYDVSDGTERQLSLNSPPTSVSISPDGQFAAVGHDALITHVDLQSLVAGAPVTTVLNVSTEVFDIVLDGRGNVHALPAADQWVNVHSVEVATNTETLGTGSLYAGARARLHPSGDYMYTANNGLSPSDIAKYDLRSGVANELYDSPYHGDYAMCGDIWFTEDGTRIYTKCGNTFRSSTTRSEDMIYSGRLQLSTSQYYGYMIQALSQSDATKEIMLLEADSYECAPFNAGNGCYTHLALYESDFLNRTAIYSLPPIELGGSTYSQRGAFVFHSSDGLHRYMISRLHGSPGATQPHFLTVVQ
jgi:chitinase